MKPNGGSQEVHVLHVGQSGLMDSEQAEDKLILRIYYLSDTKNSA
jgi:hypothetical protein